MTDVHRRRRSRWLTVVAVTASILVLVAAGCGSSKSSSSSGTASTQSTTSHVKLAKTKFGLHAGLAFGAFHHFIYRPFRSGALRHPLQHKLAFANAALAVVFVRHELVLALHDAQADRTLSRVVAPITALQAKLTATRSAIKSGNVNGAQLNQTNGSIGSIKQQAASAGHPITEQVPATPSG